MASRLSARDSIWRTRSAERPEPAAGLAQRLRVVAVRPKRSLITSRSVSGSSSIVRRSSSSRQAHLDLLVHGRRAALEQVAEGGVALLADRPVEARDGAGGVAHLLDLVERQLGRARRSPRRSARGRASPTARAPRGRSCARAGRCAPGCGSCAPCSRGRAGSPGGSRRSRRSRTCSPCASRTSRPRGSGRRCPPGSGRAATAPGPGTSSRSRRRGAGSS